MTWDSTPGLARSPGEGYGDSLQYFCLDNHTDSGAWWLWSTGMQKVGHDWSDLALTHTHSLVLQMTNLENEVWSAAAAAKSLQSCPTLCNPIDGSPPGSPVPGILQARTLEWVAISFSNAWKWKVKVKSLSRVWLLATLWTAAYQAPPSMGFSRQEYWSGVPLPSLKCGLGRR